MLKRLAQLLYPPACVVCSRRVPDGSAAVCRACERDCPTVLPPVCQRCGTPLHGAYDLHIICRRCPSAAPAFEQARAPFLYRDAAREAVRAFKYRGRDRAGGWLAEAMARTALTSFHLAGVDGVVAVPLHWIKRRLKGWNPAEALSRRVAARLGLPYQPEALARVRWTATQTRLTPSQRRQNVAAAFLASPGGVRRRSLLLVDDVLTTGSTAHACAAALKGAGARSVFVLTAARAVVK